MANYFVSYDLNGQHPTHPEMDAHLKKLGPCVYRVLETVWFVRNARSRDQMYGYVGSICSDNDRVLIVVASDAMWRNLLVSTEAMQKCWEP